MTRRPGEVKRCQLVRRHLPTYWEVFFSRIASYQPFGVVRDRFFLWTSLPLDAEMPSVRTNVVMATYTVLNSKLGAWLYHPWPF